MPPKTRSETKSLLEVGQLINLEVGGRTIPSLEVLEWDDKFIKLRWSITVSPQTEIVLIPWTQLGAIGLVGER